MFNALTFDRNITKKEGDKHCRRIFYAGSDFIADDTVENFLLVSPTFEGKVQGNVYVESLSLSDKLLDELINNYLEGKSKIILNLSSTLDEVGSFDKKYGYSPVFFAEKLGLLEGAYVAGATYVDKDDLDIIKQNNAEIIITPSLTLGDGLGIPPIRMMETLGIKTHLGTGLSEYNPNANLLFERDLIRFAASGYLCTKDALSDDFLRKLLSYH